ncbi:MAG: hypothetical protein OCD01_09915 [Fibrobacterales bacterium]
MSQKTVVEIKKRFDEISTWIKSLDHKLSANLLNYLGQCMDDIDGMVDPETNQLIKDYHSSDLFWPVHDVFKISNIFESFKKHNKHIIHLKDLRKINENSVSLYNEGDSSKDIEPRNILFEFDVASNYLEIGAELKGWDDVQVDFQGHHLRIECKRPQKIKNLRSNCIKAYEQLKKKTDGFKEYSIIYVSSDRMLGLNKLHMNSSKNFNTLKAYQDLLVPIIKNLTKLNDELCNRNFLGFVVVTPIIDWHKGIGQLKTGDYQSILFKDPLDTKAKRLIRALEKMLEKKDNTAQHY